MKKNKLNDILLSEQFIRSMSLQKVIGFHSNSLNPALKDNDFEVLVYNEDKHLITFASTGSGKSRSVIIPNLLVYDGPTVVFDPKGELFSITARARQEMGHDVVLIDPFNTVKTNRKKHSLNLFDTLKFSDDPFLECQTLAYNLSGKGFSNDPYWDESARSILAAIIGYIWFKHKEEERNMKAVTKFIYCEDLAYKIAVILDTEKELPEAVADGFKSYLQIPGDKTRPCVDSTLYTYMHIFNSTGILKSLDTTSFDLNDFIKGKPLDIYIAFPVDKLRSHSRLFLQWILLLISATLTRKSIPKNNTLFILDEAAALGENEYIANFITQCRGYGVRMWTFWQDLQQLTRYYKNDYKSIINNCGVIQIFGILTYNAAHELFLLTNIKPDIIRNISPGNQIVLIENKEYINISRPDYLLNIMFEGKYDPNPYHRGK